MKIAGLLVSVCGFFALFFVWIAMLLVFNLKKRLAAANQPAFRLNLKAILILSALYLLYVLAIFYGDTQFVLISGGTMSVFFGGILLLLMYFKADPKNEPGTLEIKKGSGLELFLKLWATGSTKKSRGRPGATRSGSSSSGTAFGGGSFGGGGSGGSW